MPTPSIPERVKIGNRTVPVTYEPLEGIMGAYDLVNFRIIISPDLSPVQLVETFWHELNHAILDYIRFSVEVQREMASNDTSEMVAWNLEETVAEDFAKVLLQVIQDNNLHQLQMPV